MQKISFILTLSILLSFQQFFSLPGEGHPRQTSSINDLLAGREDYHQVDQCYEALTCEDKIILSQVIEEFKSIRKNNSAKLALMLVEQSVEKLSASVEQKDRILNSLRAAYLKQTFKLTKEGEEDLSQVLASELQLAEELNSYYQNYLASVKSFYQVIDKIKESPTKAYMLYSLADRSNWQGKFINLFVDVPDFKDTPLGMSIEWLHTARSDFISKFQSTLLTLGRSEVEANRYTDFLRAQLQQQKNQMEDAVISADNAVLGNANTYKKSYQMVLSGTIIMATWGTAGPFVFTLNGAGLYLGADSAVDLSESLIDAYGEGGSGNFYCSFARTNLHRYSLSNTFTDAAIGGGMAFVAGGLLHAMFKSSSKLVTVGGSVVAAGALLYGAKAIAVDPGAEIVKLQREREYALENNDYKLERCLALAQKKIGSGIAVNTTALLLSFKGLGEATFGPVTPKTYNGVNVPENSSVNSNQGGLNNKASDSTLISWFSGKKLPFDDSVKNTHLKKVKFPRGKVTPRPKLPQAHTGQVEQGIINLNAYLKGSPLEDIRLYSPAKFTGHPMRNILEKMFLEVRERFMDPDFVLKNLRDITSEFEHFRRVELGEKGAPRIFEDTWRDFIRYIGREENLPVEEIPTGFISANDFRKLVGKKLLLDTSFSGASHGETTHALQVLFIYRHFKDLKVPDHVIDEFFVQISRYTDDLDEDIWGMFFDNFGQNWTSPETLNKTFKQMKFYMSYMDGI